MNPRLALDASSPGCQLGTDSYEYWHWGPDEALDLPGGYAYGYNSLAISWAQMDSWVGTNPSRLWVAPYFNATREESYRMQEELGVKITGDQKLSPLPSWTISTLQDGKRYPFLSEPVSEWFVNGVVAQSLEKWPPGQCHDGASMRAAVDFYYGLGALVNLYSHTLSDSPEYPGEAEELVPEYISYCTNHAKMWAANAKEVYDWWVERGAAQIGASQSTNGANSVARFQITGAINPDTAVEIVATGVGAPSVQQVRTNGQSTTTDYYRILGKVVKVRVGTVVTNVEIEYVMGPEAQDDSYSSETGAALSVPALGVLANDTEIAWPNLIATNASSPGHGTLTLTNNGGFLYQPNAGFSGQDCFTYEAKEGTTTFGLARVRIVVTNTGTLFEDNFTRCPTPSTLAPWEVYSGAGVSGQWRLTNEVLQGSSAALNGYGYCWLGAIWTNYSVEAKIQLPANAFGGGLGGRLNPATGAHYAAWIYPESSPGGSNVLALVKFSNWTEWGYGGTNSVLMTQTNLASVGTIWHTVKLKFNGSQIDVYFNDLTNPKISMSDAYSPVYTNGGVSIDMWTGAASYTMSVDDVVVRPYP